MKKNILILGTALLSISLMAMGLKNKNDSVNKQIELVYTDFFYGLSPRFDPIKKSELKDMKSVNDFNTRKENKLIVSYESTALIIVKNERPTDIREYGETAKLNGAQLELLQSLEYASHFQVRTEFLKKNSETGKLEFAHYGPHYTVVPEKQAEYTNGKKAFVNYLNKQNKENTANLDEDKLQFAKLYFMVSKTGLITNVRLDRTTGYEKIDNTMVELLKNTPGKWTPAENAKGEKVDQELVVSFGMNNGC